MNVPEVSIIIPCLNEEKTISKLLEAILHQTFPVERMEVVIADGMSEDRTRARIEQFQQAHSEMSIRVCDNPERKIPVGLNIAIRAARAPILTRMDAHTLPALDYVEKSVVGLKAGLGANVGGVIDVKPSENTWIARSISIATAHPLGVGDAKYRWTTKAGTADTVAFGTYYKKTVESIGDYNEALLVNEDYEFNARLRASGGKVWIDPAIRAVYYSRPTFGALARQYFTYGFWKFKMLRKNPGTLRLRQALPPLFVFGVLMLLLLAVFSSLARILLLAGLGVYLVILTGASLKVAIKQKDATLVVGVVSAIMSMHFSWGAGFWWSILKSERKGS
jgi:glycosyltransferase involved in cell wall biosynthesis